MNAYTKIRRVQYYLIIGLISLISLFFLPMLGTVSGLAWNLPDTLVGWVVYVISKLIVAVINMLIFHCFVLQAKVNVQQNPKYIRAVEILTNHTGDEELLPRSPGKYLGHVYGNKGVMIFITSILSVIGLTQSILTFDFIAMLTYLFTIVMGIIFGVLQMNETEVYWTEEYYRYALLIQKKKENTNANTT